MEIKWRISGEKDRVKSALDEWITEFNKYIIELAQKQIEVPIFGRVPVPIFSMNYEEDGEDFILKVNLPFPDLKGITKGLLFFQIRKAEKQLKKFFERKGVKVKIKRL
jgi:hypothetical protein